ncbi:unnamed protein product [Dicrocoelium dendriticum]|nr:unnamed protein product [Dicrocoelium dendriticum]
MYARRIAHWLLVLVCGWVAYLTRRFLLDTISRISAYTPLHVKCRNSAYPRTNGLQRVLVPDELVDWRVPWEEYLPIAYTNQKILGMVWADPDIQAHPEIKLRFNEVDGKVDRTSFMGRYRLDSNGLPLNPRGRTGITGRGELGRWGPNHAADPIVTRSVYSFVLLYFDLSGFHLLRIHVFTGTLPSKYPS